MAFDTICVKKIVGELDTKLTGGRIDKIYQPEKDELLIAIRTLSGNYKLVISASANNARIHFTDASKENPKTPPMFCMLLRKHISSGKITAVLQPDFERIIRFDVESYNEFGDLTTKHLIAELTGRNSNIILCDENYKIIDSAKHVDFTQSSVRQILPGLLYVSPPKQDKIPVLSEDIKNANIEFSKDGIRADKAVMAAVSGISPVTAREIVYSVCGDSSVVCGELSEEKKSGIARALAEFAENILFAASLRCLL